MEMALKPIIKKSYGTSLVKPELCACWELAQQALRPSRPAQLPWVLSAAAGDRGGERTGVGG